MTSQQRRPPRQRASRSAVVALALSILLLVAFGTFVTIYVRHQHDDLRKVSRALCGITNPPSGVHPPAPTTDYGKYQVQQLRNANKVLDCTRIRQPSFVP